MSHRIREDWEGVIHRVTRLPNRPREQVLGGATLRTSALKMWVSFRSHTQSRDQLLGGGGVEVCFGTTQRTSAGREEHSLENRCWERWALVNYDVSHNKENKCWEDGGVLNVTQPREQVL